MDEFFKEFDKTIKAFGVQFKGGKKNLIHWFSTYFEKKKDVRFSTNILICLFRNDFNCPNPSDFSFSVNFLHRFQ